MMLPAQHTTFNPLDNWGHKTLTQSKRKRTGKKKQGGGDSPEHRTHWKVAGSNPCWNGGRKGTVLTLISDPFHPRVTTVARKKSRSFCQKCRWQVTAKQTLRIEPCFGIACSELLCESHSSGAVWESRWTSWAVRPSEPSDFRGRKDLLHRASALVTTCP